jgi:hypothetical protein
MQKRNWAIDKLSVPPCTSIDRHLFRSTYVIRVETSVRHRTQQVLEQTQHWRIVPTQPEPPKRSILSGIESHGWDRACGCVASILNGVHQARFREKKRQYHLSTQARQQVMSALPTESRFRLGSSFTEWEPRSWTSTFTPRRGMYPGIEGTRRTEGASDAEGYLGDSSPLADPKSNPRTCLVQSGDRQQTEIL